MFLHLGEITPNRCRVSLLENDSTIAVGFSGNPAVELYDLESRSKKGVVLKGPDNLGVSKVASCHDKNLVAVGYNDGSIRIWKVGRDIPPEELPADHTPIYGFALSGDGGWLASGARSGEIIIWHARNGKWAKFGLLKGHSDGSFGLAWLQSEELTLASASLDTTVRLWDVASLSQRAVLRGHKYSVSGLAVNPDGTELASFSASGGRIHIWRAPRDVDTSTDQ